jgi:hypothetical protein
VLKSSEQTYQLARKLQGKIAGIPGGSPLQPALSLTFTDLVPIVGSSKNTGLATTRHPGAGRGPASVQLLEMTGFRPAPE